MLPPEPVTVVIPTRDRLAYLKEALASVWAQRHPVARVVVVDDGSSDGTADWLASGAPDSTGRGHDGAGWRVVRREQPGGGSAARNAGLAECDTAFVLFLDDDDVLRPGAVGTLAAGLAAEPVAAGCAGAFRRFGTLSEAARDLQPRFHLTVPVWREELFGWNMQPSALLWRAAVVRQIGGWDPSLPRCEDRDINLRAYPRPFALVPATVMDYRVHPQQPPGSAQREVDRLVLDRFIASLPAGDRRRALAVRQAHERLDEGLPRYVAGDFRAALPSLLAMVRRAPELCWSPILGPWLVGLVAKAAVGAVTPRSAAAAIQSAVRGRRPAPPSSPEQDSVA